MLLKTCKYCQCENYSAEPFCKRCGIPFDILERKPEEKVQYFTKAANLGYASAQIELGTLYNYGWGVPQNYAEALKWYRLAAEQGDPIGQNWVGVFYHNGQGVPQNYTEALKWYRLSAEQGNSDAQNNIGVLYEYGQGVTQDYKEARKWYRMAADQGNALAQNHLGILYQKGLGVRQNYVEALKWYRLAADQGNALAQGNLGYLYSKGLGVLKNYAKALRWYRLAAEQGDPFGQNWVGVFYHNGQGVPQNYAEALKWYRLSAEQGNSNAQDNIGVLYEYGQGVPQDYEEARKWYRMAAEQGLEIAKTHLDNLEKKITEAPIKTPQNDTSKSSFTVNSQNKQDDYIESLLAELNSMIGLQGVKTEVQNRINRIRIAQQASAMGSKRTFSSGTLHMVFTGNPGTGKTTVARLLGKIYGALGVLKNPDVFVECGRDDLVAGFIGQTAALVKNKFEEARGGILFIDEAYSLYQADTPSDFGHEAINTIVQYMDTMRDEIIVIVAGYRNEMEAFIRDANPGLSSRFRITINFEDYTKEELLQILEAMIRKDGMTLDNRAKMPLEKVIRARSKRMNFGNARGIRNLFEDLKEIHDTRLAEIIGRGMTLNAKIIDCIALEDVQRLPEYSRTEELDLSELISQLDAMVGLRAVKRQLKQQMAVVQSQLYAEKAGITTLKGIGPQHMIFAGNPGTGKTTVARLVGKIYEVLGLVADSSIFVECGRGDLVGQYIGQTAPKVQQKVKEALGGILFIDEAYSLYQKDTYNDFGKEAISELVKEMENHRDNLIVIMAGYTEDMKNMISNANAGLKSRFPIWLDFEDYTIPEMEEIFLSMLNERGYQLEDKNGGLHKLIEEKSKEPDFGNGRGVRNLVDRAIAAQSMRLASIGYNNIVSPEDYTRVVESDLMNSFD